MSNRNFRFGVLGAGVIGLSTCLELQKEFPNAEIHLIAEKFNRETTSDGAAGIFRPGTSFSLHSEEDTKFVIDESFRHYDDMWRNHGSGDSETGVSQISGYIFSNKSSSLVRNALIENVVPVYRSATPEELKIFSGNWKFGSYFVTTLTECRKYLPWCLHKFQENGGKVIVKSIKSLDDVGQFDFDFVFNCLGLGAKTVFNDRKLVPIRGQVIKVSAPWIKNFFYADYDTYVIPGLEQVTLGGCRNFDSYDLEPSPYDAAGIWNRCTKLVPSLLQSSIEREWVGLRPHRDPVRVEASIIKTESKIIKCVHNYGHGGYGVMTAPGSAKLAVKMATRFFTMKNKL